MKKRVLLLTSILSLATLLASCGGDPTTSNKPSDGTSVGGQSTSTPFVPANGKAEGAYNLQAASYDERTKILGTLEKYVYDEYLGGIPLFENGGYVRYNNRLKKGTETYINGYGFGNISDGKIESPLAAESNPKYKMYYHTWDSSNPNTINALDADGSQVSNLAANISSSYFGTRLNATKDGYVWYGVLSSKDRPVALNMKNGLATKWKVYVRTGKDGVKYSTLSSKYPEFNNRGVELEDYLTTFKILFNQKNQLFRGAELANMTGSDGIKGAKAYYDATKNGDDTPEAESALKGLGIKTGTDTEGDFITFDFMGGLTEFYAMYQLASSLYQPIPASFIEKIGGIENYGNFSEDKSTSPVDNMLSLAPYTLETWEPNLITFKKNENWFERKSFRSSN